MATEAPESPPPSAIRAALPGLMLAMLLSMMDAMIVSTALPTIVGKLGGFDNLAWVVTAYMLTSTVSTPLWGKFGDMFGRKLLLVIAVLLFLAGSALTGLSQSMGELIAFRAVQGLGAGGVIIGVMTAIGVLSTPAERGKFMSYIALLSAVATVAGPLFGGVLTEHLSWRWAFYVNLPVGAVALFFILTKLRMPHTRVGHRVDYLGALSIIVATTCLVLVCAWGGVRYAWGSATILALLGVGAVGVVATVFAERRAAEPILMPGLFRKRNYLVSLVLGFLVGVALYSSLIFLPLYQQNVQRATAATSGLLILPVLCGMLVTSWYSGKQMKKPANHRLFMIIGGVLLSVASVLLAHLGADTNRLISSGDMVLFGFGLGFIFQNVVVVAQNSVANPKDMGAASGGVVFFRSVGGLVGVSVFSAVFSSRLHDYLATRLDAADLATLTRNGGQLTSSAVQSLSSTVRVYYVDAVAHATQGVFTWALPFFILAILAGFAVKVARPQQSAQEAPQPAAPVQEKAAS